MARLKRRKDGRYLKNVYIGKKETDKFGADGKPILINNYKTIYGYNEKEVEEKALQLKIQIGKGIDISSANDTFEIWGKRFIKIKQGEGLSYSHINGLKNFISHLSSLFNYPISKIETHHIRDIIYELAQDKVDDNGEIVQKALSKRTLGGIRQCAKQIFDLAIESRSIEYNPVIPVKIPKKASVSTRHPISEEYQQWIRDFPHKAQRAAMIMLYSGLRRGEVTAFTWKDIDFDEKTITVNKSVEYITNQPTLKGTKSQSLKNNDPYEGARIVDVEDILLDFLKQEKENDNNILVIHMHNGKMMSKIAWQRMWDSYMKDLNVEYGYTRNQKILMGLDPDKEVSKCKPGGLQMVIKPFDRHQLRHTFATNCYFRDIPVEVCKEWMGHADVLTTLKIYTHLDKQYKRKKANIMNEFRQWQKEKQEKENIEISKKNGTE